MAKKRKVVRVGTVFGIPLGDDLVGYAQVVSAVHRHSADFFMAAYDITSTPSSPPSPATVVEAPLLLLACFFDDDIQSGLWFPLGDAPVPEGLPFPAHKVGRGSDGRTLLEDHTGTRARLATDAEAERLPHGAVHSSNRLPNALRALNGMGDWQPHYDKLKPVTSDRTTDFFGADARGPAAPVAAARESEPEHVVEVHITLTGDEYGTAGERRAVAELQDRLERAVQDAGVGDLDGDEIGGGEAVIHLYGEDRERLWAAVQPIVTASPLRPASALLRTGPDDDEPRRIDL